MSILKVSALLREYAEEHPDCKFNSTDLLVLHTVIKYYKSNRTMDLTNNKLGDLIFACEKTVRNSINNLCGAGLITKEKIKNRRILEYIPYKNYV